MFQCIVEKLVMSYSPENQRYWRDWCCERSERRCWLIAIVGARNLLLHDAGFLKVADFGLGKLLDASATRDLYAMTGETGSCKFLILSHYHCLELPCNVGGHIVSWASLNLWSCSVGQNLLLPCWWDWSPDFRVSLPKAISVLLISSVLLLLDESVWNDLREFYFGNFHIRCLSYGTEIELHLKRTFG